MGLIQSRLNRMNRARQPVKEEPSEGVFDPSATLHADVGPSTGQRTMPAHWDLYKMEWLPSNLIYLKPIVKFFGTGLCLASLGHADLQEVWDICADDKMWLESTARLMDRLNTIVVVAGLLLSSTAAFVTTTPPLVNNFDYNMRGPYICFLLSFATSLGTLVVGSAIIFVVSKCSRNWFIDTHMGSRSRIVCTMYLIGFPFISMGISTSVAAVGLLVSAWASHDGFIVKGAIWMLLLPLSCLPVWIWTQRPLPGKKAGIGAGTPSSSPPVDAVASTHQLEFGPKPVAMPAMLGGPPAPASPPPTVDNTDSNGGYSGVVRIPSGPSMA